MLDTVRLVVTIALAAAFVFMGVAHFVPASARTMAAMIPQRMRVVSARRLVQFTGLCEIAGGIGLLVPFTRLAAVVALIVFLVAVFPANVFAAQHPETFRSLSIPLVPRLLGQLVIMALLVFTVLPL